MIQKLKESFEQFKNDEPGKRFHHRYEKRQQESQGRFDAKKLMHLGAGLLIAALGIFFIPAPGPGSLIIIFGLAMFASEFEPVAKFMDHAELLARAAAEELKAFWAKAPVALKAALSLTALVFLAAAGYGTYHVAFGNG